MVGSYCPKTKSYILEKNNYLYHVWVPDGSGRTIGTNDKRSAELMEKCLYIREDGLVACFACGSNCGQCGIPSKIGNIGFSFQHICKYN